MNQQPIPGQDVLMTLSSRTWQFHPEGAERQRFGTDHRRRNREHEHSGRVTQHQTTCCQRSVLFILIIIVLRSQAPLRRKTLKRRNGNDQAISLKVGGCLSLTGRAFRAGHDLQIHPAVEGQATSLGARPFEVWKQIDFPIRVAPHFFAAGTFAFMISLGEFAQRFTQRP